jgi:hypothetical protein
MARPGSAIGLVATFDEFLFAPIGNDRNGMPLSVLSALVRLDVDPWAEAAGLARLSAAAASSRLASLITEFPYELTAHQDPATVASRLVALLPRETASTLVAAQGASAIPTAVWMMFCVFWMVFLLGSHLLTPPQDAAPASPTTAVAPPPQETK